MTSDHGCKTRNIPIVGLKLSPGYSLKCNLNFLYISVSLKQRSVQVEYLARTILEGAAKVNHFRFETFYQLDTGK